MKRMIAVIAGLAAVGLAIGAVAARTGKTATARDVQTQELPVVQAILAAPLLVPPPIDRKGSAKVLVSIETQELTGTLANGMQYTFWTFGDTVPGPFVRVRVGDLVQLRLKNADGSKNPHSIDLHAVTGPGGGAAATQLGPDRRGAGGGPSRAGGLFSV